MDNLCAQKLDPSFRDHLLDPVRSGYGDRKRNAQAEFFSVWTRSGHSTNAAPEVFTTELQAVSGLLGSSGGVIIV